MMKNIADILAECIDEITAGTATIEECLARHEDIRGELEPLLRMGLDIEALPRVSPTSTFKSTSKAIILEHIRYEQAVRERHGFRWGGFLNPGWVRGLAVVLVAVIVLSGAGAGTVFAAGDSLPGETLYSVKTGWEDVRDWLETDEGASADLQIEFAGRRLEEMARLLEVSPDQLPVAVSGYERNLQRALENATDTGSSASLQSIAENISGHMAWLDDLEDAGVENPGLGQARETAMNQQMTSLRAMAGYDAATAGNVTLSMMQQRMQRASGTISHGQMRRAEQALQQFLNYAVISEEIRTAAGEQGVILDEMYNEACVALQNEFAGFAGDVSPQLAEDIELTFGMMKQYRYGQTEQQGHGSGQSDGQGNGPGGPGQDTGMQSQSETPGQVANGDGTASESQQQQDTQTGESINQDEQSEPQTTITPPQQPAGPEQGQGPVTDVPGQGPVDNGETTPSDKPRGSHS